MKYLVAVSGGVDSVVLLDMLVKRQLGQLVVAHFDHGIRDDSATDAVFVKELAAKYGLSFVSRREELGSGASEELARKRRYAFLQGEAKIQDATIVTAHHKDDVIETIAINIYRGTGWRGLAVFGDSSILRPLLSMAKAELYEYAVKNKLEWVEDSTNREQKYLRNRMRANLHRLPKASQKELEQLWKEQTMLRDDIAHEIAVVADEQLHSRYFLTGIPAEVAIELLRACVAKEANKALQRPQLERALLAIKAAKPHATFTVGEGISLRFSARSFIVQRL